VVKEGLLEGKYCLVPGLLLSSVGVDEETIKRYVEHQEAQDSGQLRMQLSQKEPRL